MSDFAEQISLDLGGNVVDGTATKAMAGASEGMGKLLEDLKKLAADTGAEAALGGVTAGMLALGTAAVTVAAGVVAAIGGVTAALLGAAKEQENLLITLGATMASTNGWSASMGIAAVQLEKLKETAALVNGTEAQMVETFTMLKRTFGGTSDEAVQLTEKLALLARQSGASIDTLAVRLAGASITGTLMTRGAAGIALVGAGIDPQELQRMKEAGQAMEYLNAKIAEDPGLVERLKDTWSYLGAELSKVQQTAEETMGHGLAPLKVALKDLIASLDSAETQASFATFGANLRILNEQLISLIPGAQTGTSFFASLGVNILKGLNVVLADLILIWKELSVIVGGVWDVLTNPEKYFGGGGKARLQVTLDEIVKLYQDNQVKIAKIGFGLAANVLDTDAAPSFEKATAPGEGRVKKIKDDSAAIAATISELWDKVNAYNETGLARQIALIDASTNKEIAAFTEKATTEKQIIDGTAAYKALAIAKEQALNFKSQADNAAEIEKQRKALVDNTDWAEAEQAKLYDQLGAVTDDYYEKQQANLNKADDAAHASIERRMDDGKLTEEQYQALVEATRKLYDAQTAHLLEEQNSIIGYRKTMEEAAASLVKTTDSIAGGVQAGLDKIQASVKSTTEIVQDYVVATWDTLGKGLSTVLLQLETGTGTLKDALKGILSSLLSSFNSMVTEMVKRWLAGKGEMSAGGSPLDSLFGGQKATIDAQGNVVYPARSGTGGLNQQASGVVDLSGGGGGASLASTAGGAVTGYGVGSLVGGFSGAPGFSTGAAIGGVVGGILATTILAGVATTIAEAIGIGAAGGGWVGAIIGAIVGGLIAVLAAPNTEQKIYGYQFSPLLKTAGEAIQSGVVDIYTKSLLPDTAGFAANVNTIIKQYLGKASMFEIHAGSTADITADVQKLLTGIVPAELLHLLIGQQRTGGQDQAGISGASTYGGTLDPKAPINAMLTDLGFTANKIQLLAQQIDTMAPTDWMAQLNALVGIVSTAKTLGTELGKTYTQTMADVNAAATRSPAQVLATQAAAVTDLLKAVSFYTGTEQITKGQEAITAAQTFYANAVAAMTQLDTMAKQVQIDAAASIKKVQDTLKTPAELFAENTASLEADYQRMRFAADPTTLQAGWAQARTDFEAIAADLVSRIGQIKTLLADMQTLQDAMAAGPVINATTDPGAWLTKNLADMKKYETAMLAASPGSPEQIAAATSMAGLIRDRYTMELDMLARVKSTIEAIDQSIGASLIQLQMSGMGSVVNGVWTPDVHAQGQFIMSQITALQGQLGTAQTPEAVQAIVQQIQTLVGQLGGQAQDPTHYAESLKILARILEETQKAADARLKAMGAAAQVDITTLGPLLAGAEKVMQDALKAATGDLTDLTWHFQQAANFVTLTMNKWGVQIADQLNTLGPILAAMVANFTDVNKALDGTAGGGGGPGGNPKTPLPSNLTDLGAGVDDARGALVDFTAAVKAGTKALAG